MNRLATAFALAACMAAPVELTAQSQTLRRQIRDNQTRLDSIRQVRSDLESQLRTLLTQARTITSELDNLERQQSVTGRLVNELDRQMFEMNSQVDTITLTLLLAQDAYAEKQAILYARLAEIYKRGPLFAFEALLEADSFGQLVSRYKYLFLASRQDQALVGQVEDLRDRIVGQRSQLVSVRAVLSGRHDERSRELNRFQTLERQRQLRLRNVRGQQRRAETHLDSLALDEERMVDVLAALDRVRRAAGGGFEEPSITTDDLGSLPWPVDGGRIVHDFGDAEGPDGTTITYQGIGISVPVGTQIRAVADGEAAIVGPFGTYGLTIVLSHGGGIYSNYHYLSMINIERGQFVAGGSVIGQSGGGASDHGPHLEFQIRQTTEAGMPIALDPVNWLRKRDEPER